MKDHTHYKAAYRAYIGSSFSPEKRAEQECAYFDEIVKRMQEAGKQEYVDRFESLFLKSLAAKSRCASPMITGPSNFPVERMRKYNEWERKATDAMVAFVDKVFAPPPTPRKEIKYDIAHKEIMINEVKVISNTDVNRLQIIFNGKPEESVRSFLKKNGYKWSPTNNAWQRQLTPNATYGFNNFVLPFLKSLSPIA